MSESRDPFDKAALEQFLAERDVPCPSCGYNLHALKADHCPECHAFIPFPFPLDAVARRSAWYKFSLVVLAIGGVLQFVAFALLYHYAAPFVKETSGCLIWAAFLVFGTILDAWFFIWIRKSAGRVAAWPQEDRFWLVFAVLVASFLGLALCVVEDILL